MKLLDILKEVEDSQVIREVEGILTDEIGKFFIVEKPKQNSKIEDIIKELNLAEFANYVKGGIEIKNILGAYKQKLDAKRAGSEALKEYESTLKEMEDAMESFRGAKKDIEDKKQLAKEKIQKLRQ